MTNWCSNSIVITGPQAEIERLAEAFKHGRFCNGVIPVPDDLHITAGFRGDEAEKKELKRKTAENLEKHGYGNWYDFCTSRWGTKWDVGDDNFDVSDLGGGQFQLRAQFVSAWAPPVGVYEALSERGDLEVKAYYRECGMGFAGMFQDGQDWCYTIGSIEDARDLPAELENEFGIVAAMEEWESEEDAA